MQEFPYLFKKDIPEAISGLLDDRRLHGTNTKSYLMAKIHFIVDSIINDCIGIMVLSSYLKAHGHGVELSVLSDHKSIDTLFSEINDFDPDIIGFSVMTPQANVYQAITKIFKEKTGRLIIWGGPHCTFMPDVVAGINEIDIICIGEGEESLLILMDRLDSGKDFSDIPGFWINKNGKWVKNGVGPLQSNLDNNPFPDRELFYSKSPLLKRFTMKRFLTQRGCPFNCNYCFEPIMKDIYKGKGKLVRRHSVKYIIKELQDVINKYPIQTIHFSDDSFNLNRKWIMDFISEYKANIDLPFSCNLVVPLIDEKIIAGLKEAGCHGVVFGVESGVEHIRINILNKRVTNEQYYMASRLLRKYKIKYMANIMFGLPTETLDDAIETVRFIKSLKVHGPRACFLKMYKGTKVAEYACNNKLAEPEGLYTYKSKNHNIDNEVINNLIWMSYFLVKLPFLIHFAKKIISRSFIKHFKHLIIFSYWQEITFFKISLFQAWQYFMSDRKLFLEGMAKEQEDTHCD